ncbi:MULTISPECIES: dihydrofolate reductase family protein [unclassified Streptomyces]|uniref:dihydrofolate reductase family protein n=1 Tax=unclassified Streptomyces TaxID=2593676 RepID=UPI001F033091|nr:MULTISPECIES: dihydrofolate reductase family protein [unclassified Streptomyces]MCH0566050.1 dihydrofolate reductase family protein [Streptomyces sp. MUM 2J]MCH0571320.1 dihydrofolate reductase family protein [Streptomyces sp. MUM 136J]
MGTLVSTIFVTLDGVYQAPGGPQEDTSGGFAQGGWSFPYADDDFGRFVSGVFDRAGAFLLGRRTYDIFASYWPKVTDPADPVAARLNSLPKHVPSATLTDPAWKGTSVVRGDLAREIPALKADTPGELQVHGSGALVRSLLDLGLLDIVHLLTFPVVLGAGRRLFPEGTVPTAFRHIAGEVTMAGVSLQTYEVDGPARYGSYPMPDESRAAG